MKRIFLLSFLLSLVFIEACKHDIPTVPDPEPMDSIPEAVEVDLITDSVCDTSMVYFINDIKPILDVSCATSGCHNASSKTQGIDLSDYNAFIFHTIEDKELILAGDPEKSELWDVIEDDEMPLGSSKLSAEEKDLIFDWITQGAKYNECLDLNSCDTSDVSFSTEIVSIINTHCLSCHNGPSGNKGVDLSNHAGSKAQVDNGKLKDALLGLNGVIVMPPANNLTECDKNKFISWINDGGKNN